MILNHPFCISPSLLPALKIGDGWLESKGFSDFRVLLPDNTEYEITDFRPGACSDLVGNFAAILDFLSAWVEALQYPGSDNVDLFDKNNEVLVYWATDNSDEITVLSVEIEESEMELITE